ncbi:phage tail spike protein [Clostridium tertium]|uniref:phage tail spike protein n=1 Tax=Clostridium tertium TaxID=1559 RepID=UPI001C1DFD9D|nr:phage tail spike protein [Clostridium tertium]MBU6135228.1 phage tail protein [Clostridium tertium]
MSRVVNIGLFSANTPKSKVLASNGEYILDDICLYICSIEELASSYYDIEAVFLIDKAEKYKYIVEESILKVKEQYGYEIFKICKVAKDINKIRVYGRQITIDSSLGCWLSDVRPTSLNGQASLDYMLHGTNEYINNKQYARDLELFSDITKINTAYFQDMNLYRALHDTEQSFKNRWGGEVKRRGYRININNRIGTNRGFQIRSNKNLLGFEVETNVDSVVTRIKPKGFNGITIDDYVDSSLINNYSRIYTKEIKYEDVKVKSEDSNEGYNTLVEAQTELIRRAKDEFITNHIDEIQATYRISFLDLSKTEEYKDYAILERCYIGDTVNVYEEKLGININVRVNKIKYNILTQEVIEIELTNSDLSKYKVPSIIDIKNQLDLIPSSDSILSEAKKNATDLINSGLKDSYVIVRKNEILIMDTQDINTAKNVWRWNNGGLGFSSTGYYGEFGTAITRDGKIVADFINTGLLNANLIRAGIIKGFNDNLIINLDIGEVTFKKGKLEGNNALIDITNGNIYTKSNGNKALEFIKQNINFYDWEGTTRTTPVGFIYSARKNNDANKTGLGISNGVNSFFSINYDESNNSNVNRPYVEFDHYGVTGNTHPITFYDKVKFWQNINLNGAKILGGELSSPSGKSGIYAVEDGIINRGGTTIIGDLSVSGNKNCIQKTSTYGDRLFYSVEDAESYLTDTCTEVMTVSKTEIGTFERVILIDTIYKECVNLYENYIVEIHKTGWGDFRIKEQTNDYFIVESDREDFTFKYTIKAKRKGYEDLRLEKLSEEIK